MVCGGGTSFPEFKKKKEVRTGLGPFPFVLAVASGPAPSRNLTLHLRLSTREILPLLGPQPASGPNHRNDPPADDAGPKQPAVYANSVLTSCLFTPDLKQSTTST